MTDHLDSAPPTRRVHPAAKAALGLALAALLLVLLAGPGSRLGWWNFRMGFQMLRWGAYLAMAGVAVALGALLLARRGGGRVVPAVVALVLGTAAVAIPVTWMRTARGAPPIHDITTDTENPPGFVAVAPLRADAPNPHAYEGDSIAAQQREAYPDIRPVMMPMEVDSAFERARTAAEGMGWEIVDVNRAQGRIEATDETFWFGFKDDVVIRVMPASGISRVDVRSVSRVGRGDAGTNARRIREYVEKLTAGVQRAN